MHKKPEKTGIEEKFYTVDDIARILHLHPKTVQRRIRSDRELNDLCFFNGKRYLISCDGMKHILDSMSLSIEGFKGAGQVEIAFQLTGIRL